MRPTERMRLPWHCAAALSGSEKGTWIRRAWATRIGDPALSAFGDALELAVQQNEGMGVSDSAHAAAPLRTPFGYRVGPRPKTGDALPHLQLDQWPDPAIVRRLLERAVLLPNVCARQSRMASPDTNALCLSDAAALGPEESFIDGHEFCHLHPVPEGSIHLTLPPSIFQSVIELGWAEEHAVVRARLLSQYLVLAYAPRDEIELEVVMELITASWNFAQGRPLTASCLAFGGRAWAY